MALEQGSPGSGPDRRLPLIGLRLIWLVLPVAVAPAAGPFLDLRSTSVSWVIEAGAWAGWAGGLLALALPRPLGLTALRCLTPTAVALAAWVAGADGVGAVDVVALGLTTLALGLSFTPQVGDALVDGSSYGPERRLVLRAPAPLLLGPVPLAWVVLVAGCSAGPLLLAGEQWIPGAVALAVGLPAAAITARALHGLARRWLVVVPGGVVVHDHLAVSDPVLLPRRSVTGVGPAPEGSEALDLTMGAAGLPLELRISEPVELVRAHRGREPADAVVASAVLVTPSLPSTAVEAITRGP